MRRLLLVSTVVALALAVQPAWATITGFQNGSFETTTGADPGAGFVSLGVGNTNLTGWTVIQGVNAGAGELGGIDYIGGLWTASAGARSLDLDNDPDVGGVAQTFLTTPGTTYDVTFDLAGNPNGVPEPKWIRVSATGGLNASADYSFDATGKPLTNMGWLSKTYIFTADGSGSTTLSFQSLSTSGNSWGPALDNVKVTVDGLGAGGVPEPVTMFSAFMAIGALGGYIRKRMKAPIA